jgi:hypothetical protein
VYMEIVGSFPFNDFLLGFLSLEDLTIIFH